MAWAGLGGLSRPEQIPEVCNLRGGSVELPTEDHPTSSFVMSLKLKAPDKLPADGVTTVAFKAWKNNLFSYLEQDVDNYLFLEGGTYETWTSLDSSRNRKRITTASASDPDHKRLLRLRASNAEYTQDHYDEEVHALILRRNAQLSKFIQLICVVCHYTESGDISSLSTSTAWIVSYLEQHYNLEKRGAHFLKVSEHQFKSGTNYQTFYREFRAAIYDNLKKRGHQIQYQNNREMESDETMSPTFEETVVLWCLEKIDPRLPAHVNKTFGHQMTGHTTLKDLQIQIFQRIGGMIQDLDDVEANRATTLNYMYPEDQPEDQVELAAFRAQPFQRGRPPFRPHGNNSYQKRSCQICRIAGRPPAIVSSHSQANCKLKNAILNAASVEEPQYDSIPFSSHDEEDDQGDGQ